MQELELESEDLQAALKELHQYVDITEEDLKIIFKIALKHAKERIALKIPVSDVMTKDVITIKKNAGLHEAAGLLSENKISGMPVIDEENHVIGIVTEADILCMAGIKSDHTFKDILMHILGEPIPRRKNCETVADVMTSPAITIKPEADIREVARILDEKRIKRLPVVDEENKLIGIISRANIIRFMRKQ
ncbi:MAG: inosine-5'-monophosphate dehydrogenase [Candidatus Methanoperedens nitroreducens]|uniref:Inosine-5'-monophosphate dehydrogenase n=1 Tax=Candidatus Methanoperedens nitratireducens TaxID=1392998 RepID=A0A0P8AIB1_9EURY|nr:CBS domain-containing protein [Candidatus Methanoperedens sp. BLZ2]KAB2946952.1 MAG: CBS domain-containing protein [Candidatus Methanoperedens sp.]KPQ44286.1 MAG: inosine-5'-monophosphate dehydrogenase [Candidatus Methanoperedens sp. BLZ1]MBZ0176751.1 CBS domain-containing protein [Candidatus Methanoperedens nitroreducens]MCX9080472.1 CBS domain-containing protein [Candidatus Methanoperedens sp.]